MREALLEEHPRKIEVRIPEEKIKQNKDDKKQKQANPFPEDKAFLKKDLLVRLKHLRSVARDISTVYLSNLEQQILEIIDLLNSDASDRAMSKKIKISVLKSMIKLIDNLSIKPEKGRRKDLKRIERAIEAVSSTLLKKLG